MWGAISSLIYQRNQPVAPGNSLQMRRTVLANAWKSNLSSNREILYEWKWSICHQVLQPKPWIHHLHFSCNGSCSCTATPLLRAEILLLTFQSCVSIIFPMTKAIHWQGQNWNPWYNQKLCHRDPLCFQRQCHNVHSLHFPHQSDRFHIIRQSSLCAESHKYWELWLYNRIPTRRHRHIERFFEVCFRDGHDSINFFES